MDGCSTIQNQQLLIHVMRTKLDIYHFITITGSILLFGDLLDPEGNIRPELSGLLDMFSLNFTVHK